MEKIVHVCLCGPMTDGFSYQENLLSKYHKQLGYEVSIITSEWIWDEDGKLAKAKRNYYVNEHNIPVHRLSIKRNKTIEYKFKKYEGFVEALEKEAPDILFVHGCQFLDIRKVKSYVKKHTAVRVFVDNHADFSNSGTNFLSKNILHKCIWKSGAKAIEPYVEKFYGVLPARVDFLVNMYGLSRQKTELLVMGADDELVEKAEREKAGENIRSKFQIGKQDFLIVTGGKIDRAKRQTIYLMEAVKNMQHPNVKLLLFGSVEEELKEQVEELQDGKRIIFAGWISAEDSYEYFAAADLVCFPGRHSVFWEQVAGQGIPMVVKYWDGTTHIDVGGNVEFLYKDSAEEIQSVLEKLLTKGEEYKKMQENAKEKGKQIFSYRQISKRAIEVDG